MNRMAEIDKVIGRLRSSNQKKRRDACDILLRIGEKNPGVLVKALPGLVHALSDRDEGVVRRAAFAVYKAGLSHRQYLVDYMPHLIKFFVSGIRKYPNPDISSYGSYTSIANVFGMVGEINPASAAHAVKPMTSCLNYPIYHPENPKNDLAKLYSGVVRALGRIGKVEPKLVANSIPSIMKALSDSFKYKSFMRENPNDKTSLRWSCTYAINAIGQSAPQLVVPYLVKCMTDNKKPIKDFGKTAVAHLAAHDPGPLIAPLIACLGNEKPSIREEATKTLQEIGVKAPNLVIPALITCLKSKNKFVRLNAALALGEIGKKNTDYVKSAIPSLLDRLKDKSKEVRQQSADALYKVAEANLSLLVQGVKPLVEALTDEYHHVRWRAVMIIGMMGEKNRLAVKDAVPLLAGMYNDPQDHVRWRAEETLKKMRVDKSKFLMAAKGLQLAHKLISEGEEKGLDMKRTKEYVTRARDCISDMKYEEAIELTDKAKEAALASKEGAPQAQPAPQAAKPTQAADPQPAPARAPQPAPAANPQPTPAPAQPVDEGVKIFCPYCGAENHADFNFCIKCRKKLPKPESGNNPGPSGIATESETKYNIYRNALEEAWKDGAIKVDEKAMLERLRGTLGLSLEEHDELEQEVRKKLGHT